VPKKENAAGTAAMEAAGKPAPLLDVMDLKTYFDTDEGLVRAVDGVSFQVNPGQTLGVVGESGCGKSVASLSILRLIQSPPGRIAGGQIYFKGRDLLGLSEAQMRKIRGNEISMVFQEPMTSLNPVFTCGDQILEAIVLHQHLPKKEAKARAVDMLRLVGIPSPEQRADEYPHQLSGGMRQRVMIAMALSCNPSLLIADEPTTALDVTIQAQILELLARLREELEMSVVVITHDLGVVAEVVHRVVVMYAGVVVEYADAGPLFGSPQHPYTVGLLQSIPRLNQERDRLAVIPGAVPNPLDYPKACRFHPRCSIAVDRCTEEEPPLLEISSGHLARCWRPGEAS
jgi:peptide/nickel transport system ATP-binding protein/oligopeptide transport system ATP-binding protein